MDRNVNSVDYWNHRFASGDWAQHGGFSQTRQFAEAQIPLLDLPRSFSGRLCDFGCGAGDAIPVYRQAFPSAELIGIDFSHDAIRLCEERYGDIAQFRCCGAGDVPRVEAIICSNVLEHIDNDEAVLDALLARCEKAFVIVPYKERELCSEHVRTYEDDAFSQFSPVRTVVFQSKGWSAFGWDLYVEIRLKNVFRWLLGRKLRYQNKQILFEFRGTHAQAHSCEQAKG